MTQSRKLAAIMFTDMVGYSALSQKNEALALQLLEEHRTLLRPLFLLHNGTEIKTIGDAFLVKFSSAVDAATCAIDIQKMLVEHNASASPEERILLRIGLHIGDVVMDRDDVLGDGVNIASRIEPLAQPGGICLTEAIADQVRNKIDGSLESLGEQKLKGIADPVKIHRIILPWDESNLPSKPEMLKPGNMRRITAGVTALLMVTVVLWLASRGLPGVNPGEITSIAVLPLENFMNDPEQDYFVDGMHEALTAELSKISALRVIGRTSTMRYKANPKSVSEIAAELNVDAMIEGSVLRDSDRVRITVQLVATRPERHLWTENYTRDLVEILELHSEVAQAIANEIEVTLEPEEEVRLADAPPIDPAVYEYYLKGRYFWYKRTEDGLKRAVEFFEQAIKGNEEYALAHAGLADSYNMLGSYSYLEPGEAFPRAKMAAKKALSIDSTLAEAHTSLAWVFTDYEWAWAEAEERFIRAIRLNPNYSIAHLWYAFLLASTGRFEEAIAEADAALALDPLSAVVIRSVGTILRYAGRYTEAIELMEYALELDSSTPAGYSSLSLAYYYASMPEKAAEMMEMAQAQDKMTDEIHSKYMLGRSKDMLGRVLLVLGDHDAELKLLNELLQGSDGRYVSPYSLAFFHVGLGDHDMAFALLQEALQIRAASLWEIKIAQELEPLHDDPRFQQLLTAMNFSE